MKNIFTALKEVLLSYSQSRACLEAIMKFDFKIGDAKTNLMQLCFSSLAAWPLVLIIALIKFNPFFQMQSLVQMLSYENSLVLFLLDGRPVNMVITFVLFYLAQWIFRKEYLFLALIFYFLNRSELHIHLATVAVFAVYISRFCYLWWLSVDALSETRKIWSAVLVLQMTAWLFMFITALKALDYVQVNHLFSYNSAVGISRIYFLALSILLMHVCMHLFLCFWGHFYFAKKTEPTNLPTYYSTANWILRFNMSYALQNKLKNQIHIQLAKHLESEKQLTELKLLSTALNKYSVEETLVKEISLLNEAVLRLSKI